jgi:hypothetical protein
MNSPHLLKVAPLALAVYGIGLTSGFAQNTPVPPPPGYLTTVANSPAPVPEDPGPRMDFRFEGVPLTETIKGIQEQYHKAAAPKYLNVVIGEHLRDLAETNTITLNVKQVTVGELLKLIGTSSQRSIAWQQFQNGSYTLIQGKGGFSFIPEPSSGGNPTYLLQSDYPAGYGFPLPTLHQMSQGPHPQDVVPAERKYVSYFSLEPFLDRFKVEDITTAVKLGWELSGAKELPTMKFHEETKLLVVSGTQDQLSVVAQVLKNLVSSSKAPLPGQGLTVPPAGSQSPIPVSPAKP